MSFNFESERLPGKAFQGRESDTKKLIKKFLQVIYLATYKYIIAFDPLLSLSEVHKMHTRTVTKTTTE